MMPAAPWRESSSVAVKSSPVLGGWELTEELGSGRWAQVFAARQVAGTSGSDYALKTLKRSSLNEFTFQQAQAMLQREALIGRQLSHPNLAPVLDWQLKNQPFLVMPRIQGCTLRAVLESRRRDFGCLIGAAKFLTQSVWTIRQVSSALAALHAAGWLHGDVKPENVLLGSQGHATLIDLGLARKLGSRECQAGEVLAGTWAYLSPESFLSATTLTSASDIYSLGVLLYELLIGQPLFENTDPTELALCHLREVPPDVREAALDVPSPLARLVARMLAKEPLRRPTAGDVARQLSRLEIELMGAV